MKTNLYLLCSECFRNHGLREEAKKQGQSSRELCQKCGSLKGRKLTLEQLDNLVFKFFVQGAIINCSFGGAPAIRYNKHHFGTHQVTFSECLDQDVQLIKDTLKVGFFYHGPPTWTIGYITHLEDLQSERKWLNVARNIISTYPIRELSNQETFFRLRSNPKFPQYKIQYDSPPNGSGRLGLSNFPVLYGSQDVEICVHECRVTLADELYLATLRPTRRLKLLDLTKTIEETGTEFESLNLTIHMLFRAEKHSYRIIRKIAKEARKARFDGVIYPSYYSRVREGIIPNIAIFGRPIKRRLLKVECINRLLLDKVRYKTNYGPIIR